MYRDTPGQVAVPVREVSKHRLSFQFVNNRVLLISSRNLIIAWEVLTSRTATTWKKQLEQEVGSEKIDLRNSE